MKNTALSLFIALVALTGRAQKDTSRLDIGWLSLDKELTQTITIKGSDLEKMPFLNLSDAISAWLYGAYTTPATLAYVVDGNPMTDVNSYSVFDIEEVTLVGSALGGAVYGGTQQELVRSTPRWGKDAAGEGRATGGKGQSGIKAAVQGGAINSNGDGMKTKTNFYQQYYLGVYHNYDKLSAGVSADWVRDVVPMPAGGEYQVTTPENLQRLRLNGYLSWRPTTGDIIELRVGYAPQWVNEALDSTINSESRQVAQKMHEHLLVPEVRWNHRFSQGLTNELRVVDVNESGYSAFNLLDSVTTNAFPPVEAEDTSLARINHLFVRERLSYDLSAGSWHFLPSLNFSYDHITEKTATAVDSLAFSNTGGPLFIDLPVGPWQEQKGDLLFLTPAVDVRLARVLDFQLGAQMNVSRKRDTGSKVLYPFATIGLDLLRFGHATGGPSLKLFGSYAQRPLVFLDDYSLFDFSGGGSPYSLANVYQPKYTPFEFSSWNPITGTTSESFLIPNQPRPLFWTWEAGASFATANGRVQLAYTFEKRNFITPGGTSFISTIPGEGLTVLNVWKSTLHHIDIRLKVTDSTKVTWMTGLNLTLLQSRLNPFSFPSNITGLSSIYNDSQYPDAGDVYPAHLSYTGGWVNRWNMGSFSAGLDLMYHFGEATQGSYPYGVNQNGPKLNSVLSSNIYIGDRWKLRGAGALELFLESRGLARSKTSDLLDDRRYYTIGGKLTI